MLFSFQISEIIMIFFSLALLLRIEIKTIVWPLAHSWSLHVAALAARAHAFMARSRLSLFLKSANSVHMIYTNVIGTLQSICRILWQQLLFGLSHDALCFNWKLNVSILYAVQKISQIVNNSTCGTFLHRLSLCIPLSVCGCCR